MKKLVRDAGRESEFIIASSATSTEEIWNGVGNPVYPPAREELKKHGVECGGKRAVQLTAADAEKYDLFLCMDSANLRNAKRILGQKAEGKVKKLLDLAGGGDVADPWYSDRFDIAYSDILRGCESLLKSL